MKNLVLQSGCLAGNFAQKLSDTHLGSQSLCAQHFSQWAEVLKRDLDEVKAKNTSKASFDTQSLAEHLITILEDSLIIAKAQQDIGIVEKNLAVFPWIQTLLRATAKEVAKPFNLRFLPFEDRYPYLAAWMKGVEDIPGYERTYPPHWKE